MTTHPGTLRPHRSGLATVLSRDAVSAGGIFAAFFLSVWFLTANLGVGTTPDSSSYLSIAANLRGDLDYRSHYEETSAHFPPAYPAMIAATSVFTFRDVRHGAPRLLSAALFGLVGALSWAVLRSGGSSPAGSLAGCSLILFQPAISLYSITALTEVPSLAFTIAGWLLFHLSLSRGSRRWLFGSAILFSIAVLIRYANVVWPCVAGFLLFIRQGSPWFTRLRDAVLYGLLAIGPGAAWMIAWKWWGDAPARQVAWHPVASDTLSQGLETLGRAVGLPGAWAGACVALVFLSVSIYLWIAHRRNTGPDTPSRTTSLGPGLGLYALAYVAFLLLSISLFDRATPLDERILLPLIWMLPIVAIIAVETVSAGRPRFRFITLILVALLSLGQLFLFWTPRASDWQRDGSGLSHFSVRYDKTLGTLREEGFEDIEAIYSNVPWIVYMTAKVDAWLLPSTEDYTSGERNADYEAQLAGIVQRAAAEEVLVVMDSTYRDAHYLPPNAGYFEDAGLALVAGREGDRFLIFGRDHTPTPSTGDPVPEP